jgi:eukaryotic-like serine/threonine-protein kinase
MTSGGNGLRKNGGRVEETRTTNSCGRAGRRESPEKLFPITSGGGTQPVWRRDGKELFYLSADSKIMAVPMPTSPALKPGLPKALFPVSINGGSGIIRTNDYDVTGDGNKFLINGVPQEGPSSSSPIAVVLNWQAELKK